jgi:dienelactone hydrolase
MQAGLAIGLLLCASVTFGFAGDDKDASKKDARLGPPRHYDLKYFPWTPPSTREAWEAQKKLVRERILVANGLWPMPDKVPLKPVIHGKIERDGYTIEKVFFASYPGHYVSGNLYKPTGKTGRLPAILSPHGHWANGRFYENSDQAADVEIKTGAEQTKEGAKYPLQARCAQLARLGCVVFHYDMVGVADSQPPGKEPGIGHRQGFTDVEAELRLQNFMGLQTYNAIKALDFLISQPYVDAGRIGVTGASGGGTQTFILCAIDDRPAAEFPAVMVGTAMQGGCICENCSYLRVEGNNIQFAAMFAPKPLGMAAANDWTKDIIKQGLPELKDIYRLYGAEDNVMAEAYLQFGHNYNQVSRELMYNFFNKHLKLGREGTIHEQSFVPVVPPRELSVYDAEHPRPADTASAEVLRRYLTDANDKQMQRVLPKGKASLAQFQDVVHPALRAMITDSLPPARDVEVSGATVEASRGVKTVLSRNGKGERVPVELYLPDKWNGHVVVWVHPDGRPSVRNAAFDRILAKNAAVCVVEVLRTGETAKEKSYPVNKGFAGYTFGYNRPLAADRAHDILTAVAWVKGRDGVKSIDLVGFGKLGPVATLARGLCGDAVRRAAADLDNFRFEQVQDANDEMMLPGGLKYGGLLTLAAVSAPNELLLYNTEKCGPATFLTAAYEAAGAANRLDRREDGMTPAAVVDWLLR